jgi:hypothetical protein
LTQLTRAPIDGTAATDPDAYLRAKGLPRTVAQAAAKKSWGNRDIPNWRDRVDDLLRGKQILVKDLRQSNSIYAAAKRKRVQTLQFKVSDSKFAVVVEGIYDRKIEFIQAGNVYYTRKDELPGLFNGAQKLGVCLDHRPIKERTNEGIFTVAVARSSDPQRDRPIRTRLGRR